jgi:rare lipoprotein A (peptidoglycan hydrolase)
VLTVVTGPPCGGKSTYVRAHRKPGDLVVDLDQLAQALGYPSAQIRWGDTHPAVRAARTARTQVIRALLHGEIRGDAWVIDTRPDRAMRAQYERAGARFHTADPGEAVCQERAADRDPSTLEGIASWYGDQAPQRPAASRYSRRAATAAFD